MQLRNLGQSIELGNSISNILNDSKYSSENGNLAGIKNQTIALKNAV